MWAWTIGIVVCIVAAVTTFCLINWRSMKVTVTAERPAPSMTLPNSVMPNSRFYIEVQGRDVSLEEIQALLSVQPDIPFMLTESAPNHFILQPRQSLEMGAGFSILVGKESFHFNVAEYLLVDSHFPYDGADKVPVDSGIEFQFNTSEVELEAVEAAFSIRPEVEGEFNQGEGRFVFYPTEGMEYGTEYTVTLDASLRSQGGAYLLEEVQFSFVTITEREENVESLFYLSGNGTSVNTLTSETAILRAYIDPAAVEDGQEVDVTLYSIDDWRLYYDQLQNRTYSSRGSSDNSLSDTGSFTKYATFSIDPIYASSGEESYQQNFWVLPFPEALPEGWYVANLSLQIEDVTLTRQIFLQVSDLSIFSMTTNETMLVWVNDAATGQPVENALVEMSGAYIAKGTTDAEGKAYIEDGGITTENYDSDSRTLFTVTFGDRVFVGQDQFPYYYKTEDSTRTASQYMHYVFADRPIYKTTDTMQIWGMVRPRDPEAPFPSRVRLSLDDDVEEQEITLMGDGTFTTTVSFESLRSSYLGLRLLVEDDVQLGYYWFRVEDYTKPVYTASTSPEKPVYLLTGDPSAAVEIDVTLFDGTPASSFGLNLSTSSSLVFEGDGSFVTDSTGHLRVEMDIVREGIKTWYPTYNYYSFFSNEAQDESFYQYGHVYVIHRDLMLKAKPVYSGERVDLEVTSNRVDVSGIETSGQLWEKDALKGPAVNAEVRAELHRIYYVKEKTGTHYDFINRVSVDSYKYVRNEEVEGTYTFTTTDGAYTLEDLPRSDKNSSYYVILTSTDSLGREVETKVYLGASYDRYGSYSSGMHRYELSKITSPEDGEIEEQGGDFYFYSWGTSFQDGETVAFELLDNDDVVEKIEGRLLYAVVQNTITDIGISDKAEITLPFDEHLVPNYVITGAYFDGKHIFALENTYLRFNSDKRELEIVLDTDQDSYSPADPIQITATVTNKSSGEPAEDATVVLAVVDEAVFAMVEQNVNLLSRMYASVYYPSIRKYTSYIQVENPGAGEKGGGGGEEMRNDFQDTAFFSTGTTDSQGKASFSFTLPDNITSWRMTSLSLTDNNHAGNTKANFKVTKDFFITPILNEELIEGDSFAVGLYGAGVGVADSDPVQYQVQIAGNGVSESLETDSTVRGYASVDFGSLPKGEYTVSIRATSGEYWDGIELPFQVTSSGIEVQQVKTFELKNGLDFDPVRYPVNISFYSKSTRTYHEIMRSVQRSSRGGRADMRIARKYIAQEYERQGVRWHDQAALDDRLSDISGTSVMRLFPYSEQDLELSVKAYLAAPDLISQYSLSGRSVEKENNFQGSDAVIYLARALTEAEDDNLQELLEKGSFDYVDQMYLVMALAQTDRQAAKEWYDRLVTPYLVELTGVSGMRIYYIDYNDSMKSTHQCTAAASMLSTMLEEEDAEYLVRYLSEKKSRYDPYLLEQLYFLTSFKPNGAESVQFSYVRNGETITETVTTSKAISFSRQQLAEADFKVIAGDVYADVYFIGAPGEEEDESQRLIGFTKTIEAVDGSLEPGSLVKITLTPDFSQLDTTIGDHVVVIDDYIPSGMRFERYKPGEGSVGWYLNNRSGQRLQFTMYKLGVQREIVYYARCSTPGDYVVESAYINSRTGDVWGASERTQVTINP